MFKRVIVIVLDSVGIGALADAASYKDFSVNTVADFLLTRGGLTYPLWEKWD
jgi:phosphopentomutase